MTLHRRRYNTILAPYAHWEVGILIFLLDRFGTLLLYKVAVDRESGRKLYQYWLMIVLLMAVDRADTAVYGLARRSFLYVW